MAINFPNNPTINQVYITSLGKQFVWTGNTWAPYVIPGASPVSYMPKFSQAKSAGESINFDYWEFRLESTSNRLQIRTTDGLTRSITGTYYYNNGVTDAINPSLFVGSTTWVSINPSWSFGQIGDTQYFVFYNGATYETYRVTVQLQNGSINNTFTIEKLWQ